LARALDIETRTARSYLDGERIPNGYTLIQLMGQCRELRDEINLASIVSKPPIKEADRPRTKPII